MLGFFNERKLVIETRKAVFSQPDVPRTGARNPVLRLRQGYGACTLLRAGLFLNHFKCLLHIFSNLEHINTT